MDHYTKVIYLIESMLAESNRAARMKKYEMKKKHGMLGRQGGRKAGKPGTGRGGIEGSEPGEDSTGGYQRGMSKPRGQMPTVGEKFAAKSSLEGRLKKFKASKKNK
jgi:hypothetical protein